MVRSTDPMTYEDGYHWLQAYLDSYLDEPCLLMLDETDPQMRVFTVPLHTSGENKDTYVKAMCRIRLEI